MFFGGYLPFHETKDPGLITVGLNRLGCTTSLLTTKKPELCTYTSSFILMSADQEKFVDVGFWRKVDADLVICYTWLDPAYNTILAALREGGKKIVIKADSDGRIGYPVMSRRQLIGNPAERLRGAIRQGYLFGRNLPSFRKQLDSRTHQMRLADAIIIESPMAFENIRRFLGYYNRSDLISKFHIIPNPVTDDISEGEIGAKKDIMICIGRWSASIEKNTSIMLKCSETFLRKNPEWRLRLVDTLGLGRPELEKAVSKWNKSSIERVEILGPLTHNSIAHVLSDSRVFFMPSNWESWGIAAAEAVCMGCTVVGTPLEPLDFLVAGGFSGTLAKGFAFQHLTQALASDTSKHERGVYKPAEIASYWRPRLSIREVASQIYKLLTKL